MFNVKQSGIRFVPHYISDGEDNYLHSDGSIYNTTEYFPTEKIAQAVLNKFQPPHIWKRGDVFMNTLIDVKMIYLVNLYKKPCIFYLEDGWEPTRSVEHYLKNAKYLFNIKEKINE